ncbi:hypothetical protein E1B28_002940 [Marasmius oreades]|uniref:Uncharacterized protein n=1 Tax=Marasmius oreades TaxID=181124 RepID=A0A9P7RKJ8_9AGAR|nr:uncharacterized protein E1B28_002940 [Marasmius oreades]KAG7085377.1 hypothetical protein E1B28_002940 [Marasmius oreades]
MIPILYRGVALSKLHPACCAPLQLLCRCGKSAHSPLRKANVIRAILKMNYVLLSSVWQVSDHVEFLLATDRKHEGRASRRGQLLSTLVNVLVTPTNLFHRHSWMALSVLCFFNMFRP